MSEEKKEGNKEIEKVEIKVGEDMTVLEQSEAAVVAAGVLLEGFESIIGDDAKRMKATSSSGVVVGTGINLLLDAAEETDPEKRSDLYRRGGVVTMELLTGTAKTLVAGNRRRMKRVK